MKIDGNVLFKISELLERNIIEIQNGSSDSRYFTCISFSPPFKDGNIDVKYGVMGTVCEITEYLKDMNVNFLDKNSLKNFCENLTKKIENIGEAKSLKLSQDYKWSLYEK